ncbi:MAG: 4-hydroxythreonine-4-phosphate dehydrogenase PdxA, partial [Planctomycetota bacterium]
MGDPTGIGPQVIATTWANPALHAACRPAVIGDPAVMQRAVDLVGGGLVVEEVGAADPFEPSAPNRLPCISTASAGGATALPGQLAYEAVFDAARLALAGGCEGLVTAPLSKANLHAAGHDYPGHTELLAELCGVRDFAMMLYLPAGERSPGEGSPIRSPHGLGVVHTTLHTSLRSVFDLLTSDAVMEKCR